MRRVVLLALSMIPLFATAARADEAAPPVAHRTVSVDGLSIFYREAGPPDAPAVLLLHGFPSSSFMYRNLVPPQAYRHDLPDAQLRVLDAGHFALETHAGEVAAAMLEFLPRVPTR